MGYLFVFLGGGLGAMLRHGINLLTARIFPGIGFPIATLTINVTGSIVMGVLVAIFAFKGGGSQTSRCSMNAATWSRPRSMSWPRWCSRLWASCWG